MNLLRYLGENNDHGTLSHDDAHKLVYIKIVVCILIFIAECFVFFPYKIQNRKDGCCGGKFFTMLTCFTAGMLLTISLAHILPEATSLYGEYLKHAGHAHRLLQGEDNKDGHGTFPLPEFVFYAGFMLMLLMD